MSDPSGNRSGEGEPLEPDNIPEGEVVEDEATGNLVYRSQAVSYRGPVPPPEWMEHYERIVPGSAKQMMDDAHEQSAHRRQIETKEVDANIRNAGRGQWMGYSIGLIGVLGGLAMAFFDVSLGGGVGVALTGLAALAAVYVTGNWRAAKEFDQATQDRTPTRQEPPESQ